MMKSKAKDDDEKDTVQAVDASPENTGEEVSADNKPTSKRKQYTCSKCGLPKKGHKCTMSAMQTISSGRSKASLRTVAGPRRSRSGQRRPRANSVTREKLDYSDVIDGDDDLDSAGSLDDQLSLKRPVEPPAGWMGASMQTPSGLEDSNGDAELHQTFAWLQDLATPTTAAHTTILPAEPWATATHSTIADLYHDSLCPSSPQPNPFLSAAPTPLNDLHRPPPFMTMTLLGGNDLARSDS